MADADGAPAAEVTAQPEHITAVVVGSERDDGSTTVTHAAEASSTSRRSSATTAVGPSKPVADWHLWHLNPERMAASRNVDLSKVRRSSVRDFYHRQNELLDSFVRIAKHRRASQPGPAIPAPSETAGAGTQQGAATPAAEPAPEEEVDADSKPAVRFAINASFAVNVCLFIIKVIAASVSGSFAVIASVVDSALDLLSGSIIYLATHAASKKDATKYPIGKTRLEPVSVVIFAAVMSVAAIQLFRESLQDLVDGLIAGGKTLHIDGLTYGILVAVVVAKSSLLAICWRLRDESASVEALAGDHFNDIVSNSVTIAAVAIASSFPRAWVVDPVLAMLVAAMIVYNWVQAGKETVEQLTGRVASPEILNQLTLIAMSHMPEQVKAVDTVRAYHVGSKILAEVDIVLPEDMPLKTAHDIGESLQRELEAHPEVERAHVHLDFETSHTSESEHVYPMP